MICLDFDGQLSPNTSILKIVCMYAVKLYAICFKTCEALKTDHTCNQGVTGAESRTLEKTTSLPLISYKRKSVSGSQTYHNDVVYSKKIDYVMVQGNMF